MLSPEEQTMSSLKHIHGDLPIAPSAQPDRTRFSIGQLIHAAGENGRAWRIRAGAVRLDRLQGEERTFAGLALKGDILGAETLLFGAYAFEARALGEVDLEPWLAPNRPPSGESLLQTLAATERRAADTLALRCGKALDRVQQLMLMLADSHRQIVIPGLKDMAEITALTEETVSRTVSRLRKMGLLQRHGRRFGLVLPNHPQALAA
jgi:CRP/FNR family nitrogen fixation transcriptional regulator